jgi:hypothetical protein
VATQAVPGTPWYPKLGPAERMASKNRRRLVFACIIGSLLGMAYALTRLEGIATADACISEALGTIPNLYGAKFEIISTNCDTLTKDEAIRVYVSRAAAEGDSWFARWRNRRELIFDYDPAMDERPPVIEPSGNHRVVISVAKASHIFLQRRTWQNVSIDYRIGRIINP